jgi:adenylate kinase family enzyme
MIGKRVVVVGTSGSGKTTVARQLATLMGGVHIELDALNWGANWRDSTTEELQYKVNQAMTALCWALDGNYSKVRASVWAQADTLVWLDFPLWLNLWRISKRTFLRVVTQESLWAGNRESLRAAVSKEGMFYWVLKTHARRRREIPQYLQRDENRHLQVVHLRTPHETTAFLQRVATHFDTR